MLKSIRELSVPPQLSLRLVGKTPMLLLLPALMHRCQRKIMTTFCGYYLEDKIGPIGNGKPDATLMAQQNDRRRHMTEICQSSERL